jgi:hypothetical protein
MLPTRSIVEIDTFQRPPVEPRGMVTCARYFADRFSPETRVKYPCAPAPL